MKISLIVPNRQNLRYFKWMYNSVRKNQGEHEVWICSAADACTDGTIEYYEELFKTDPYFKYIVNPGPERVGHTILYDRIIEEICPTEIAMIFHCDMYLCPKSLDALEYYLYNNEPTLLQRAEWLINTKGYDSLIKSNLEHDHIEELILNESPKILPNYKTIVSLTRIEPQGLHPDGPEKILSPLVPLEPEEFDESKFLDWYHNWVKIDSWQPKEKQKYPDNGITHGIFAPWAFFVKDFLEIGGHDPLYRPQSKEDSDIFNRFKLAGFNFIQTWDGCVAHLTCRGSRFNPSLTTPGKNSSEWEKQNIKSARNFYRKWGAYVKHDEYLNPIVPHKYNIGLIVHNCIEEIIELLEPVVSTLYVDCDYKNYIEREQPNTLYDLSQKIYGINTPVTNDIIIECDANKLFRSPGTFQPTDFLYNLSEFITENCEIGKFEYDCFTITVNNMNHYEMDLLIKRKNNLKKIDINNI